jgi:hypothetical protein
MSFELEVDGGKYTLILSEQGSLYAKRHGEPWRDLAGDGFILALGQDLIEAQEKLAELQKDRDALDESHDITRKELANMKLDLEWPVVKENVRLENKILAIEHEAGHEIFRLRAALEFYGNEKIYDELAEPWTGATVAEADGGKTARDVLIPPDTSEEDEYGSA